jgi:hypothetical protein
MLFLLVWFGWNYEINREVIDIFLLREELLNKTLHIC